MLGALMYASKVVMEVAPNVHLLGVFTMAFTLVYVCVIERIVYGICHMVDPVPVSMGSSVGRDDAASAEHAEKDPTDRLYACQCQPWLPVRYSVCTGTGNPVWPKL